MYYPIQIPYILDREFADHIRYKEEAVEPLRDFVICIWQMTPRTGKPILVENVITTDGCIDLVAAMDEKRIGFAGMSKTNFDFRVDLPARFMGARMKPGAFYRLTGRPATAAMDTFLPLDEVDMRFERELFFSMPFEEAKAYFIDYLCAFTHNKTPDAYTMLFDRLAGDPPPSAAVLYEVLHFSPRQCQRNFRTRFGLTPQTVLSILRFQKCLEVLTAGKAAPGDILRLTSYYDQAHFINDFKRNIGLTPFELVRKYTT